MRGKSQVTALNGAAAKRSRAIKPAPSNRFEVAKKLEQAILSGKLEPGARLVELRIASEFRVSQASVREALLHLESVGLVQKLPNRESRVTKLSLDDIAAYYEVRRELEPLACTLAATSLMANQIAELARCIDTMRHAPSPSSIFTDADIQFHRIIWSAQPNRILERSLLAITLPLFAAYSARRSEISADRRAVLIAQHERLLNVLRMRDPERARKHARRLVDHWMRQDLEDVAHGQ